MNSRKNMTAEMLKGNMDMLIYKAVEKTCFS